jgi:hypothetical protein
MIVRVTTQAATAVAAVIARNQKVRPPHFERTGGDGGGPFPRCAIDSQGRNIRA